MNIAFIIGGWYFPKHLYQNAVEINKPDNCNIDFYVVSHRNPSTIDISAEMKTRIIHNNKYDLTLYNSITNYEELKAMGYRVDEVSNTIGDYYFFNQWTEIYDYSKYDYVVFMHDDNYLLPDFKNILTDIFSSKADFYVHNDLDWVKVVNLKNFHYIANSIVPTRKTARGSFSIWTKQLIDAMGGKFSMEKVQVTREGKKDNPTNFFELDWNTVGTNFQEFIQENGFLTNSYRLSPYYRVSKYMIEGERGLISSNNVRVSNMIEGMRQFNL